MASANIHAATSWHAIKGATAVHAAGAWHTLQQIWVRNAGAWHQAYQRAVTYSGTITPGSNAGALHGFSSGSFGSVSPTTDSNGDAIFELTEDNTRTITTLQLTGLAQDPTQSYFTTMTLVSTSTYTSATAVYTYASGTAKWVWSVNNVLLQAGTVSWSIA